MGTKEHDGDCFEVHARFILNRELDRDFEKWTLVHGMVEGRGEATGYRFAHCWIERDGMVLDVSNNGLVRTTIENYYELGNISNVHKYNSHEVLSKVLEHEHWGCWDFVGNVEVTK